MTKRLIFLLILIASVSVSAQEQKIYYGLYGSGGLAGTDNWERRFSYELGTSFLIQKRNGLKSFREVFLQFSDNRYYRNSLTDYINSDDDSTYSVSHYRETYLQLGFKWNVSLYNNERYNILLSSGFLVGKLLSDYRIQEIYYTQNNLLKSSTTYDGYSPVKVIWGITFGLKNMFTLSENMQLIVDVNYLAQASIEYEPSVTSHSIMLKTGIYFQLPE
jgi:hypothetical protein